MSDFFPGFEQRQIETSSATINLVTGGSGPPLLLLHGYPQTHVMWRKVALRLAQDFTVVVPDLRGYGDSSKPPAGENFINYSKRALALDQVEVMARRSAMAPSRSRAKPSLRRGQLSAAAETSAGWAPGATAPLLAPGFAA